MPSLITVVALNRARMYLLAFSAFLATLWQVEHLLGSVFFTFTPAVDWICPPSVAEDDSDFSSLHSLSILSSSQCRLVVSDNSYLLNASATSWVPTISSL